MFLCTFTKPCSPILFAVKKHNTFNTVKSRPMKCSFPSPWELLWLSMTSQIESFKMTWCTPLHKHEQFESKIIQWRLLRDAFSFCCCLGTLYWLLFLSWKTIIWAIGRHKFIFLTGQINIYFECYPNVIFPRYTAWQPCCMISILHLSRQQLYSLSISAAVWVARIRSRCDRVAGLCMCSCMVKRALPIFSFRPSVCQRLSCHPP